jgi:hypothetical protein
MAATVFQFVSEKPTWHFQQDNNSTWNCAIPNSFTEICNWLKLIGEKISKPTLGNDLITHTE